MQKIVLPLATKTLRQGTQGAMSVVNSHVHPRQPSAG